MNIFSVKMTCPYCGKINHIEVEPEALVPQGSEDAHTCSRCNMHFLATYNVPICPEVRVAPCLNGIDHHNKLEIIKDKSGRLIMVCADCGETLFDRDQLLSDDKFMDKRRDAVEAYKEKMHREALDSHLRGARLGQCLSREDRILLGLPPDVVDVTMVGSRLHVILQVDTRYEGEEPALDKDYELLQVIKELDDEDIQRMGKKNTGGEEDTDD